MKKSKVFKWWLIILAAMVIVSILNWGVVTGWGNVRITNVTLVGDGGKEYTALLYTPKNATNDNKAPGLLCFHGYSGNARNHESWSMEYARRGFVVLAIDNFGSGDGEFYETQYPADLTADELRKAQFMSGDNNKVATIMTDYMYRLPNVDTSNIVITGHSMGCSVAVAAGIAHDDVKAYVFADPAPMGAAGKGGVESNVLWLFGTADKLYTQDVSLTMASASFASYGANVDGTTPIVNDETYKSADGQYIYRHEFIPHQVHEAAFIDLNAIRTQIDFVQEVVNVPNAISGSNQLWPWKDVCGFVGTLLYACFLAATAMLIIDQVPFFSDVKQPLPRNIGLRGVGLAISVIAAFVFPVVAIYFGGFGILKLLGAVSAYSNVEYGIFRLRFTNIAVGVVMALTLMGMIMLVLYLCTDAKKAKANLHDLGLTTEDKANKFNWKLIGKAFLLAVITIAIGYTYLALQRSVLRTDFYCLFFGVKAIASRKFVYYIPYLVIWMLCFVFSAISMNVERRLPSTGNEKKDTIYAMIFNGLLNCLALIVIVIVENQFQIAKGCGVYGFTTWGTDVTRLWGMPLGMFIGGCGSTYCYRKTGSVWLGAFLFGLLAALMACTFGQVRLG